MKAYLIIIAGIMLAALEGGCTSAAATPTPDPTAQLLAGTYTNAEGGEARELDLAADGTFFISVNGQRQNDGVFALTGDQIAFTDNDNRSDSCLPAHEPGVYRWTLNGNTLTLDAVSDLCTAGRRGFLIRAWTRQP